MDEKDEIRLCPDAMDSDYSLDKEVSYRNLDSEKKDLQNLVEEKNEVINTWITKTRMIPWLKTKDMKDMNKREKMYEKVAGELERD
jgi:hypothetical protein